MRGASDLVGDEARDRRQQRDRGLRDERRHEADGRRQVQCLHHIGRHVDDQIIHRGRHRERTDRKDGGELLLPEHLRDRRFLLRGRRRGRIVDMVADIDPDRADQHAEQERQPPAPGLQILRAHQRSQKCTEARAEQAADALARELPARDKTAALGHVLDQECGRGAELASRGKALHQPRQHHRDRRQDADRLEGRHQRQHQRAERHQHDRQHQRGLAAVAVSIGAEHDAADRADQERQAEAAEGQKQRGGRIIGWEERLGEVDREIGIDRDVVPFERVADRGCDDQAGDVLFGGSVGFGGDRRR